MPLVLSCGKFYFQTFSDFQTGSSRYNLWYSAGRNRFISNPVASISTEIYQFLTLVTRTKYSTKKFGSEALLADVKFCSCDYDNPNFWGTLGFLIEQRLLSFVLWQLNLSFYHFIAWESHFVCEQLSPYLGSKSRKITTRRGCHHNTAYCGALKLILAPPYLGGKSRKSTNYSGCRHTTIY